MLLTIGCFILILALLLAMAYIAVNQDIFLIALGITLLGTTAIGILGITLLKLTS